MKGWRHAVIAVALLGAAGCGGYAGDQVPQSLPGTDPAPTASAGPGFGDESPVGSAPSSTPSVGSVPPSSGEVVSCTLRRGSPNRLVVRVDPEVRANVSGFRVQMLQGRISRQVVFPVEKPRSSAALGIRYDPEAFVIRLTGAGLPMNAAWLPTAPVRVTVEGRGPTEAVRYWRSREVRFRLTYPNGRRCDPEVFSAVVTLRPKDRAAIF